MAFGRRINGVQRTFCTALHSNQTRSWPSLSTCAKTIFNHRLCPIWPNGISLGRKSTKTFKLSNEHLSSVDYSYVSICLQPQKTEIRIILYVSYITIINHKSLTECIIPSPLYYQTDRCLHKTKRTGFWNKELILGPSTYLEKKKTRQQFDHTIDVSSFRITPLNSIALCDLAICKLNKLLHMVTRPSSSDLQI